MNVTKREVLLALSKHAGKWCKSQTIAKEVGLNTSEEISRVSNILYRLRHAPDIERKRNSHAYQYRYCGEIAVYPTSENAYLKTEGKEKAIRDSGSDMFTRFSFVELIGATEGFCELCGVNKKLSYKAEKSNRWIFVCKQCGEEIKKQSDIFEWGEFSV